MVYQSRTITPTNIAQQSRSVFYFKTWTN